LKETLQVLILASTFCAVAQHTAAEQLTPSPGRPHLKSPGKMSEATVKRRIFPDGDTCAAAEINIRLEKGVASVVLTRRSLGDEMRGRSATGEVAFTFGGDGCRISVQIHQALTQLRHSQASHVEYGWAQIDANDPDQKSRCGFQPCFATRFAGVSGGNATQGWRDSSHTAMVGAGNFGSAKLPMATATYPGKPLPSQ
jgi:hypothetical protein